MIDEEQVEGVINGEKPKKKEKKPKSKARKIIEWVLTGIFVALFGFFAVGQVIGMTQKTKNYNETLTYGYGAFVIKTNSMEPEYKVKTAIITHKDSPEQLVKNFEAGKHVDVTFYCAYVKNYSTYGYPNYNPDNIDYGGIHYEIEGHNPVYPAANQPQVVTHRMIGYYIDETKEVGQGKYTFVLAGINTQGELSQIGQYQLATENEILGVVKINSPVLGEIFRFITQPWGLLVFLLIPAFYLVITSVIDIFKAIKEPDEENANPDTPTGAGALDSLSDADRERLKKEMLDQMLNKKGGDKDEK